MRGIVTHSQVCRCGPARQRAHTAVKRVLAAELRRMHFETDIERVVPELSLPESDAIMDLVTFSPDSFSRFLIDVTVRTPHASRCTHASVKPGRSCFDWS